MGRPIPAILLPYRPLAPEQSRSLSPRTTRAIALLIAISYFAADAVLFLVSFFFRQSDISFTAPFVLSLPCSVLLELGKPHLPKQEGFGLALYLGAAALNAVLGYLIFKALTAKAGVLVGFFALLSCGAFLIAGALFMNTEDLNSQVRIISNRDGRGVFVAVDEHGLRAISESLAGEPREKEEDPLRGLVFLPNRTKGRATGSMYLLKGGDLVPANPAGTYDQGGAVQVERIQVTEGPYKGVEGWIHPRYLRRMPTIFAL